MTRIPSPKLRPVMVVLGLTHEALLFGRLERVYIRSVIGPLAAFVW